MDRIQLLHRIGACENQQAQADWQGPAIPPCAEHASYLCQFCGHLLCGAHAGGHSHAATETPVSLVSRAQAQNAALREEIATLQRQLASAEAAQAKSEQRNHVLEQLRQLLSEA